jgi:drug/metabolite transporter (DMT)-like permease
MPVDQRKAYFYALLSVLLWSTVASAFKISLRYLSYIELLMIASTVSTLALFLILSTRKKIILLKALSRRDIVISIAMGFLSPFLYYLLVFKSYSLLPAQQAQPLNLIWGIVIVIMAIPILKQKVRARTLIAVFISFAGVIVISTEGQLALLKIKNPLGVSLALGSSVFWSLYWLFNARDKQDPLIRLFLNFCFGTLFIFIYMVLFCPLRFPRLEGIIGAAYTGLFEMGITFYFWLKAMKLSETAAKVSILIYIMPFLSLVLIHLVVGETILFSSFVGLVLIVGGIVLEKFGTLGNMFKSGSGSQG